jgi:O-antigen/teichoic acid export membrane protein
MYLRLIITSIIGLYSIRILLRELGTNDYGLYAIIGGVVAILNVMSTSLISTSNRFLAVEIGKKDNLETNNVFNSLLFLHFIFSVVFLIMLEIIGKWYVQNQLNIETNKIPDALFILRCSAVSIFFSTVIMPYEGLITVKEKFNVKAIIEILNSALNLIAVLLLIFYSGNKIQLYAIGTLFIRFVISAIYYFYCRVNFKELTLLRIKLNELNLKPITGFFGWQLVYVFGNAISRQGSAIILNSFFGTSLNAAFGIANRINEFLFSFVKNLNQVAVPQIVKNHSGGDENKSLVLVYKLSKYTYFIILLLAFPIIISIDSILNIWLGQYPPYTIWFVILLIVTGLISSLESGFDAFIDATGKIGKTKIYYSIIFISVLPIIYLLFYLGFEPYWVTIIFILGEIVFMNLQISILTNLSNFKRKTYFKETLVPTFLVTVSVLPQFFLRQIFNDSLLSLIIKSIISVLSTLLVIFYLGLDKTEKETILSKLSIKTIFNK